MEKVAVLKMTWGLRSNRGQNLKLEGEILEPWVGAVREACTEQGCRSGRLRLDLSAVTFVDAAGARLLRELVGAGIEIAACSGFVAELLRPED